MIWQALTALATFILSLALPLVSLVSKEHIRKFAHDYSIVIAGTIISKNGDNNIVLLKFSDSGKVEALRVGFPITLRVESTPQQFVIKGIHRNYIAIEPFEAQTDDEDNFIKVYKDGFTGLAAAAPTRRPSVPVNPMADSYREEGFERNKNEIAMTEAYRDNLIQNDLPKILMQASAEPFVENGQMIGFMLDQIDADSIFAKAGIKDGDVITSINDISLDDITATIKLLHSLKKSTNISFEIRRHGQTIPVQLQIK